LLFSGLFCEEGIIESQFENILVDEKVNNGGFFRNFLEKVDSNGEVFGRIEELLFDFFNLRRNLTDILTMKLFIFDELIEMFF